MNDKFTNKLLTKNLSFIDHTHTLHCLYNIYHTRIGWNNKQNKIKLQELDSIQDPKLNVLEGFVLGSS